MFSQPVFLITDILIFGLVLCIIAFFTYALRKPHLRQPWRQVMRSKAGVISMLVLLVYIGIALIDSLHFHPRLENQSHSNNEVQYSGDVISVFDQIVATMRASTEKLTRHRFLPICMQKKPCDYLTELNNVFIHD